MHCPKCGSIINNDSESCKFCKTIISETYRQEEEKKEQEKNNAMQEAGTLKSKIIDSRLFQKYGLDIENYSNSQIKEKNAENIRNVGHELAGSGWIKSGLALSFKPYERQSLGYLSVLMEQNWILIRQNELIIRLLEKDKKPEIK